MFAFRGRAFAWLLLIVACLYAGMQTADAQVSTKQGGSGVRNPGLVAGTNVTITGTWPNQTVAASGGSGPAGFFDMSSAAYGGCTTSTTDSSTCFNSAIAACAAAGGGTVTVPAGRWTITNSINVAGSCALMGQAPPHFNYPASTLDGGSVIVVNTTAVAVFLGANAGVKMLGFDYPGQNVNATSPVAYGATVQINAPGNNLNQFVEDCYFLKSYIAIDFRGSVGGGGVAGPRIINNAGTPISIGLAMDFLVDWGTIHDNSFNAGSMNNPGSQTGLRAWTANNGQAFYFGGNDWILCQNCNSWGYSIGFNIVAGAGYTGSGPYTFIGSGCDACFTGIALTGTFAQPIQVTGGRFAPFNPNGGTSPGAVIANASGSTINGLIFTSNYVFGPVNYAIWLGQASQTVQQVVAYNNVVRSDVAGGPAFVFASGDKIQVSGNMVSGIPTVATFGTSTNTLDFNNNVPSGGGGGCTTTCTFTGTVTAADLATGGNVTASSGTVSGGTFQNANAGIYGWTSNTGMYGNSAGTNVGVEVGGTTMWSTYGTSFQLGTGITAFKDGGGSWTATSDQRTKKNITDYKLGLNELRMLHPVAFQYNGKLGSHEDGKTYVGLIAQAVQGTPFASMVGHHPDPETGEPVLDLDNSQLVYALVNAVVDISKEVETLKKRRAK